MSNTQIVAKIQENATPIVMMQTYDWGDGTGVLSVRIKNDKKGPQTGDVVLDLDDATISLLDYDPTYEYEVNNVCIVNGMIFRAKVKPTMGVFKVSEWEEIDSVDILAEDFKPFFAYEKNQVCVVNHMFYRAIDDFMSDAAFDIKDWEEIGGATIDDYMIGMHINKWQPVIYNHALYRSKEDFTASNRSTIEQAWEDDKDKFEEIRSGDSTIITKEISFEYDESTKTFEVTNVRYQLNTGEETTQIDRFIHDETIEVEKTTTASGVDVVIKVPVFKDSKLGVIRGGTILPNPKYRGETADQGTMDFIDNPQLYDFCDRMDTRTEWSYNGTEWVNTGQAFNTTPHEKVPDNYVQADANGFGFVNLTSDNLLRIATDKEASRRESEYVAVAPIHLALYGGNLIQVDEASALPAVGKVYDTYYVKNERRIYLWDSEAGAYIMYEVLIKDFAPQTSYDRDTVVVYNQRLYRANYSFTSTDNFDPADWNEIGRATIENYQNGYYYTKNSVIYWNGSIYRAKDDFEAESDFDPNDWEPIGQDDNYFTEGEMIKYIDSSNGNDKNDGNTSQTAYKTLDYAVSEIKKVYRSAGGKIELRFSGGNYETTNSEIFSNIVSAKFVGNNDAFIIYKGNSPVYAGGAESYFAIANSDITFEGLKIKDETSTSTEALIGNENSFVRFISCEVISGNNVSKTIIANNGYLNSDSLKLDSNSFITAIINGVNGIANLSSLDVSEVDVDSSVKFYIDNNEGIVSTNEIAGMLDECSPLSKYDNANGLYQKTRVQTFKADTFYAKDSQIEYGGLYYRAKEDFYSGLSFDETKCEIIEPLIKDYESNTYYAQNQSVLYNSVIYRARESFISGSEFDYSKWLAISDITNFMSFESDYEYQQGTPIVINGKLYIAKNTFISGTDFHESDWENITSPTTIKDFSPNTDYERNETIYYQGVIYRAKASFKSRNNFDFNDWQEIASDVLDDYQVGKFYLQNEAIVHDGIMWLSNYDQTAIGDFDKALWTPLRVIIPDWEPNQNYYYNQIVKYGDKFYILNTGESSESDFDITQWHDVGGDGGGAEPFTPGSYYKEGNLVVYDGRLYKAKTDAIVINFDTMYFDPVVAWQDSGFLQNSFYPQKALIIHENKVYRAKADFTTATAFDENDWDLVSGAGATVENYTEGIKFKQNDLTVYKQRLYQAKEDFTSTATFDITKWTPVDESAARNFVPNQFYPKDAICVNNGALYRAKENFTSGASFNLSNWDSITSLRKFVPVNVEGEKDTIAENDDLNQVKFLIAGTYNCSNNNKTTTLKNCPTRQAFTMNVFSYVNGNIGNDSTYEYKQRRILDLQGRAWTQSCVKNNNGSWSYGRWKEDIQDDQVALNNSTVYKITHQAYGTNPPAAQANKTIICLWTEN